MIINGIQYAPLFGFWNHTADQFPPPDTVVLGIVWVEDTPCVRFIAADHVFDDDDSATPIGVQFYDAFEGLRDGEKRVPIAPPVAWCEVRFDLPMEGLDLCHDCGGLRKVGECCDEDDCPSCYDDCCGEDDD
jgi:hypothetical protein